MGSSTILQLLLGVSTLAMAWTQGTFYSCPPVDSEEVGACVEACLADSDCSEGRRCCSNGCGHTCREALAIPYHPPTLVCPEPPEDVAGICSEECNNCSAAEGQLCCSNGCGHVCMEGVASEAPCSVLRDGVMASGLLGAYVPQCEADGSFSSVQCHASTGYCWCVAEQTGMPVSDLVRFTMPQCNCTYYEQLFKAGEVFPSLEGGRCDVCSCTVDGDVSCTHRECAETNVSIFYSCPAVRAGASDHCQADCLLHSECPSHLRCCYNGCGYSCMEPHQIPYIDLAPAYSNQCPPPEDVPCLEWEEEEEWEEQWEEEESDSEEDGDSDGSESSEEWAGSCRGDEEEEGEGCDPDELCCDNDCGSSVCVGRVPDQPCLAAVALTLNASSPQLYGRYRPLCTLQGLFREIQCHAHFCWCVEPTTGEPLSDTVPFEQANVLACATCVYNGRKYRHLESFLAGDGCNTCTCIGGTISCSRNCEPVYDEDSAEWEWWHSVLIGCVVVVVVLVTVVMVLVVGIMILMKQNSSIKHHRLKEPVSEDCELVEYRNGQDPDSVELKVPVEDTLLPTETEMGPANA